MSESEDIPQKHRKGDDPDRAKWRSARMSQELLDWSRRAVRARIHTSRLSVRYAVYGCGFVSQCGSLLGLRMRARTQKLIVSHAPAYVFTLNFADDPDWAVLPGLLSSG